MLILSIIAIGSLIDGLFPSWCHSMNQLTCIVPNNLSRHIHLIESTVTGGAILALNLWCLYLKKPWAKQVLVVQIICLFFILTHHHTRLLSLTFFQFVYEIIVILWIASIVPALRTSASHDDNKWQGITVKLLGGWLFISGLLSIIGALTHLGRESHLSLIYMGETSAWLSQHGVVTGIVMLYITRHLWRGEYRAWQIAEILLWFQTIKYALWDPDIHFVLIFGFSAIILFMVRPFFNRWSSIEQLSDRIKKLLVVVVATVIAVIIGTVLFEYQHHHGLGTTKIGLAEIFKHLLLLDTYATDISSKHKLVGQVINVAGLTLMLTVLISLFQPVKFVSSSERRYNKQEILERIKNYGQSSEDYFKFWPEKAYWQSTTGAVVAYNVINNVAFALADPIAQSNRQRQKATKEFLLYCRQNGWRACFLMVNESNSQMYSASEYKLFRIGASAVIDIQKFIATTRSNKWWRWVRNKAARQNYSYAVSTAPHNNKLMRDIARVSNQWLTVRGHQERGFAMGYYDKEYLQTCRLHLLNKNGKLIAFANELPTSEKSPTATVDLMRYLPDEPHAMAVLLAEIISKIGSEDQKKLFDLGFVPLASPQTAIERGTSKLGQLLMGESMSARGLEQFKNKFQPEWQDNYLAFDGDWADMVHIGRSLRKLLDVTE